MANQETVIQNESMLEVGCDPDVLVWRQQVGNFRAMDNPNRIVKIGVPGMSDAMMIVRVKITPEMVGKEIGVAVAPEFKVPRSGRQSDKQKLWQASFERRGGVYRLIRSAAEMLALVRDVKEGRW